MPEKTIERRCFLKLGLAAGAVGAAALAMPKFSLAAVKSIKFSDCQAMSPVKMAENSRLVMDSWKYLKATVETIKDPGIRKTVKEILANPAPTLAKDLMDGKNRKQVYGELKAKGYVEKIAYDQFLPAVSDPGRSPFPFYAGPGSGYSSHHSYPGGLVTHTAANLVISLSIYDTYRKVYGFGLDRDMVITSQVLHDLHKPWVFQWAEDGESRTELSLAGTGEHHSLSVAESFKRGLPAEFCVAQACAHNHPGFPKEEAGPVNWITTAGILLGIDPREKGLLSPDGKTLPRPRRMENFVCHLGDHDWILTVPAAKWLIPVLQRIAQEEYGLGKSDLKTKKFNQFRNYVFSQATIMTLYETYSTKGYKELLGVVKAMVAKG